MLTGVAFALEFALCPLFFFLAPALVVFRLRLRGFNLEFAASERRMELHVECFTLRRLVTLDVMVFIVLREVDRLGKNGWGLGERGTDGVREGRRVIGFGLTIPMIPSFPPDD